MARYLYIHIQISTVDTTDQVKTTNTATNCTVVILNKTQIDKICISHVQD